MYEELNVKIGYWTGLCDIAILWAQRTSRGACLITFVEKGFFRNVDKCHFSKKKSVA